MTTSTGDDENEEDPEDFTETMRQEKRRHEIFTESPPVPKPRRGDRRDR